MPMRLHILTWNIHKGIGGLDRSYRLSRIIETIRDLDPDVCLLQEVSDGWPTTSEHEQADLIQEGTDLPHLAFAREHRFRKGGYGNAILSRYPIREHHHIDLTIGWRKKRGVLLAKVQVRDDHHQKTLALANFHLGLAGSERGLQLERFLACDPFRGLHGSTPVIVGGDLNDLWGSLGPRYLEPAEFRRAGKLTNTFPAYLPLRPLDGLFFRGPLEAERCGVPPGRLVRSASDHLPLLADFELEMG